MLVKWQSAREHFTVKNDVPYARPNVLFQKNAHLSNLVTFLFKIFIFEGRKGVLLEIYFVTRAARIISKYKTVFIHAAMGNPGSVTTKLADFHAVVTKKMVEFHLLA